LRSKRLYFIWDSLLIFSEITQPNCEEVSSVSRLARNLSKGREGRAGGVQSEVSGTKEQDGESASHENSICKVKLDGARGMYIGFLL